MDKLIRVSCIQEFENDKKEKVSYTQFYIGVKSDYGLDIVPIKYQTKQKHLKVYFASLHKHFNTYRDMYDYVVAELSK